MSGCSMIAVPTEVTAEMSPAETAGMPSPAVLRTGWHNHHQREADYKRPGLHETPRNCQPYTARPARCLAACAKIGHRLMFVAWAYCIFRSSAKSHSSRRESANRFRVRDWRQWSRLCRACQAEWCAGDGQR
jgi:hypothetical protein